MWIVSAPSLVLLYWMNYFYSYQTQPSWLSVGERVQAGWAAELSSVEYTTQIHYLMLLRTGQWLHRAHTWSLHSLFLSSSKSRDKCYCDEGMSCCQQCDADNNQNKPVSKNSKSDDVSRRQNDKQNINNTAIASSETKSNLFLKVRRYSW